MSEPAGEPEGQGRRIPRLRLALLGIAALLVVTIPLWAPLLMRGMNFFRARRLEIVGTRYIAPGDIVKRADVDTTRSVWDPLGPIGDRVRLHPGIQSAEVSRRLPGTIVITVTEHQPIALVPGPQGFRVFDRRGIALPIDPSRVDVDAPVLAVADTALLRLLGDLRSGLPRFYARVSELRRAGARDLLFQLDGSPVRTLRTVSLEDLHQVEPVEADLRRRAARVTELDLRYSGQIIARIQ